MMEWGRASHPVARSGAGDHGRMRTVGVEEELLVVDPTGRPVPLGPDALAVAARRGEGETTAQHDQDGADQDDAVHLMPELTAQQLELGTPVCGTLDEVEAELRCWRSRAGAAAGPIEVVADAAGYHRLIHGVLATDTVLDSGMVYFDARLSEKWPTVEVRTADVALRVEDAVTLAGVVRGLVETAARDARAGTPPPAVPAQILRLAVWRAGRSGLTGDLVHPCTGRPAPAAGVVTALLEHVRPALSDAGDEQRVTDGLAAILRRGTGADLQRHVHRESGGDLGAVVRAAVAVTAGERDRTGQAPASRRG